MFTTIENHGHLINPLFMYNGILINLPVFGKYLNRSEEVYVEDCIFATSYEIARFVDNTFYNGNSVRVTRFARSYVQYKDMNVGALYGKLIIEEREFPMKLEFIGNDLCVLCPIGFDTKAAEHKIRRRIEIPKYKG